MQKLTIVIPNYNGAHLLRRNLPSVIQAANVYAKDTAIIVVDDGSKDNSLQVLQSDFPEVKVVSHQVNQGFSEAVLTGVKAAQTELLFLLNSDVELHSDCLPKLEPYFDDQSTFSVSPLMINDDGSINRHSWNLRSLQRGYLKLLDWTLEEAKAKRKSHNLKSLYACGGCMMVRKSMFLQLGGFHPIYKPFYAEDFDLGIRAWYQGWPTYFEPDATLIHQSQGSIKDNVKRAKVKEIRRRNRYYLEWIHLSLAQLFLINLPYTIFQLLGELLILDMKSLRGFATAIKNLPEVIKVRKEVLYLRRRRLTEILTEINMQHG